MSVHQVEEFYLSVDLLDGGEVFCKESQDLMTEIIYRNGGDPYFHKDYKGNVIAISAYEILSEGEAEEVQDAISKELNRLGVAHNI